MAAGKRRTGQQVTSHDVARAAGVSQSAVSRALSRMPGVSDETREKIVRIADELGYQPNALASGLITSKSGIVGVVLSQLTNPFLTEATDYLVKALRRRGLQGLVFSASGTGEVGEAVADFSRYRVDGCFVLSPHLSRQAAERYARLGPTVILFNSAVPGMTASTIAMNNLAAGAMAADRLIELGHTRLAYVHCNPDSSNDKDRFRGFAERARERADIDVVGIAGAPNYPGALASVTEALADRNRPTAIFCSNDLMAMATVDTARFRYGMKLPDDLAVIGFDNAPPAAWPTYNLTTIDQPVPAMTDAAIDILLNEEAPGEEHRHVVFEPELIPRGTA